MAILAAFDTTNCRVADRAGAVDRPDGALAFRS
jgi:hypothetical protein